MKKYIPWVGGLLVLVAITWMISTIAGLNTQKAEAVAAFTIKSQALQAQVDSLAAEKDSITVQLNESQADTVFLEPKTRVITRVLKDTVKVTDTLFVSRQIDFDIQPKTFDFRIFQPDSFDVSWQSTVWGSYSVFLDSLNNASSELLLDNSVTNFNITYTSQAPLLNTVEYKVKPLVGIVFTQYDTDNSKLDAGIGFLYQGKFWGSISSQGKIGVGYEFSPKNFTKLIGL